MDQKAFYFQLFESSPQKSDHRRFEIVLATITSLNHFGVEGTTFETIGKELKLKASHIAYYFPKKEDAFDAAVKLVIGTSQSYLIKGVSENSKNRLRGYVNASYDYLKENPQHWCIFTLFFYWVSRDQVYRDIYASMCKMGSERISSILREMFKTTHKNNTFLRAGDEIVRAVHNDGLQFIYSQDLSSLENRKKNTWTRVSQIIEMLQK